MHWSWTTCFITLPIGVVVGIVGTVVIFAVLATVMSDE